MENRKKLRMIMAGIFCIGVLMGGIGTGIAFSEFSSFAYQPIYASEEAFKTEEFTYFIKPEDSEKIWIDRYYGESRYKIEENESLSEETIKMSVAYNSDLCEPDFIAYTDDDEESRLRIHINYIGNDLSNFMKYKDIILEGIRNRELRDYQEDYIKEISIQVNPAIRSRLFLN